MGAPVITLDGIGKRYKIGALQGQHDTIREHLTYLAGAPIRRFRSHSSKVDEGRDPHVWAVKDVSLEVKQGDVVGVVGRNGAGKSTLLSMLSRITEPTTGEGMIRGRIGSLLEVGTGFHGELTGRENIFLNGAILGMGRREITRKFDDIVEFAEVSRFVDTPVKRYSTGMHMRLAFSVAAHLDTEVLLVDEVLAVGDSKFQAKCLGKMSDVAHEGRTILFVSHNMGAVAELCTRAILLDQGRKIMDGSVAEVVDRYARTRAGEHLTVTFPADESLPSYFTRISVVTAGGDPAATFAVDEEVVIELEYVVTRETPDLLFNVTLARNMVDVFTSFDTDSQSPIEAKRPGSYVARHRLPAKFLKAGLYSLTVGSGTPSDLVQNFEDILSFEVEELGENAAMRGYRKDRPGQVVSPGEWTVDRLGD
jgi:homopolymeric O-antigen transport system ATP-binding protein